MTYLNNESNPEFPKLMSRTAVILYACPTTSPVLVLTSNSDESLA